VGGTGASASQVWLALGLHEHGEFDHRGRNHWPALRIPASWASDGNYTAHFAYNHGGLDDTLDCDKQQAEREQQFSRDRGALLWEAGLNCYLSIAQWAFAFGGMVAFGIIVGDSIPHVLAAVFPGLRDIPVLSLLTNRRAVIVIFILGISYPLSLYRDIAKVGRTSKLFKSELTKIAGKSKHSCVDQHGGYFIHSGHPGFFCAQRIKRYL
jgi:hypothetical protein